MKKDVSGSHVITQSRKGHLVDRIEHSWETTIINITYLGGTIWNDIKNKKRKKKEKKISYNYYSLSLFLSLIIYMHYLQFNKCFSKWQIVFVMVDNLIFILIFWICFTVSKPRLNRTWEILNVSGKVIY